MNVESRTDPANLESAINLIVMYFVNTFDDLTSTRSIANNLPGPIPTVIAYSGCALCVSMFMV